MSRTKLAFVMPWRQLTNEQEERLTCVRTIPREEEEDKVKTSVENERFELAHRIDFKFCQYF